jgi:hypothetical protein
MSIAAAIPVLLVGPFTLHSMLKLDANLAVDQRAATKEFAASVGALFVVCLTFAITAWASGYLALRLSGWTGEFSPPTVASALAFGAWVLLLVSVALGRTIACDSVHSSRIALVRAVIFIHACAALALTAATFALIRIVDAQGATPQLQHVVARWLNIGSLGLFLVLVAVASVSLRSGANRWALRLRAR